MKSQILQYLAVTSLDAKRKCSQTGIESWYPYYAGFTEDFVMNILRPLKQETATTVMDPWNGSGTTTRIASRLGFEALGFDINPISAVVAAAKLANPEDVLNIGGLARRLCRSPVRPAKTDDPLLRWLPPTLVGRYRTIERRLLSEVATSCKGLVANPKSGNLPPLASFLLLGLIRTARQFACVARNTNPTWIRPGEIGENKLQHFSKRWIDCITTMARELTAEQSKGSSKPWLGTIALADSRHLPIEDERVDVVLGSPPYCTRIDYIVSSSFELAALGFDEQSTEYLTLRQECMGSPLTRKGKPPDLLPQWPGSVKSLLQQIKEHPSSDSRSYYYKTFWQYFHDAEASLSEIKRTLRKGGVAILVVQSSYYKDIHVDLPDLYMEIAEQVGFRGSVLATSEIKRVLTSINSQSTRHRSSSKYCEAVIALEKPA